MFAIFYELGLHREILLQWSINMNRIKDRTHIPSLSYGYRKWMFAA